MFITPTQSQNHTKVHVVIFTFWKSLSCLLSVLSQTLSLYFPHYSKLEKNRGNFTYFHVLEAEVAEAELAGRWDCWGWLGWAGPEDSAGPGGCAAEPWGSAFLSRVLKKPKRQMKSGRHLIKGKRWPETVPLPPHMTQGYGSCSFC